MNYDAQLPEDIQKEMDDEADRRIEMMLTNAFLRPYVKDHDVEYFRMMFEKQFLRAKLIEIYDQLSDTNAALLDMKYSDIEKEIAEGG